MILSSPDLTDAQFQKISDLVYRHSGINLKSGKEALVRARLMKRFRALGMDSVDAYLEFIGGRAGSDELNRMIDVMTTNKTSFYREIEHFKYLQETVLPQSKAKRVRLWSAACSSGEEPYSIAMTLKEYLPDIARKDVLILATDISTRMLEKAQQAIYSKDVLKDVPPACFQKYFVRMASSGDTYQVHPDIRALVRLGNLNLMNAWPMKGPFNIIFCRNVMIYFDRDTQQHLINRFWEILEPGGYLFVGHSEGLSSITHKFKYIRPATYKK